MPVIDIGCNFNSSVVQLKALSPYEIGLQLYNFNSSVVQLKAYIAECVMDEELFQFLSGTIKRSRRKSVMLNLAQFQFLSGTIKRARWQQDDPSVPIFQFLSGTIKSCTR